MKTLSIPDEFVARVDFDKFWEYYLRGPATTDRLVQAKRDLLDTGMPTLTVFAYFFALHRTLSCEGGNEGLVEPVMNDLLALHELECVSVEDIA